MAKTFTEEERDKLIEQVGSYYLITKESYRDIAKEFGISAPTVKDYIEKYKKLHGHLAAEIDASIKEKTLKMLGMYYLVDINTITDLKISDKVIKNINYFVNTYYDRYTGLYLKSKKFLNEMIS